MQSIKHLSRIVLTGLAFGLFGLGGAILSFTVLPIIRLLYSDEHASKSAARSTVHYAFKFFVKVLSWLRLCDVKIENARALSSLRGHLILANHPSLIDVVVLISAVPNADCIVKAHLFNNALIRRVIQGAGYISNANPEALLLDCQHSLASGNNLIIFPEGTRTPKGEKLAVFQRGAANVALRSKAKITLAQIHVSPTTLTKQDKWYHIPFKRVCFDLKVLDRSPNLECYEAYPFSLASRKLTQELTHIYQQELNI
ncbi:lysophospholipid acyltransferase family protein [Pseudoalteromonas rubra]|uniref:lysophospholipid acyltransferase family protein n=1 Tax=Pseudoalteromonas rubra TaxID=43658 RepID=UPI000F79A83B|nr:lysophospholipid acyltransferase family protein [Pseudoalteromonas rubra]